MKSNLTLDYGLRISHFQPTYDKEDRLAIFDPGSLRPGPGGEASSSPCAWARRA